MTSSHDLESFGDPSEQQTDTGTELFKSIASGLATLARAAITSLDYSAIRAHLEKGDAPWFLGSFLYFMKFVEEDAFYIEFTRKGIDTFLVFSKRWETRYPERLKDRFVELNIAKQEQDRGYPGLFARHVVSLWNMLDATLTDSVVQLLVNDKKAFQLKAFAKIKLSVAEFEALPRNDFVRLAVAHLKQQHASTPRMNKGARIYDGIYRELGFEKQLSDDHDRLLVELRAVRNAIVHNMSIVDERFARDCPWLKRKPAESLHVTETEYNRYKATASAYVLGMIGQYSQRYAPWMNKESS